MSAPRFVLRAVAAVGPVLIIGWQTATTPVTEAAVAWSVGALVVVGAVALVAVYWAFPRSAGVASGHADLLVPLGVTFTLTSTLGAVASLVEWGAYFAPFWSGKPAGLALALSASFLVGLALAVLHAGWTTALVLQAHTEGEADLLAPFARAGVVFPRALAALAIGTAGVLVLLAVGVGLGAAALPLAMLVIGGGGLVWNLMTAGLLPAALASRAGFLGSLAEGFSASNRSIGRTWLVVALHMLLLGWVTFFHVSYQSSAGGRTTTTTKTNWSVNGFWTGGYEADCRWYGKLMETVEAQPVPAVAGLFALAFGALAVVVKLEVLRRLVPAPEWRRAPEGLAEEGPPPARYGPAVLALTGLGCLVAIAVGAACHRPAEEAVFVWQFRRAVVRGEPAEELTKRLESRGSDRSAAVQLAGDADSRVRLALLPHLVGDATPARPRGNLAGSYSESWNGFNHGSIPALELLLKDPDPEVRQAAIRAVGSRRSAGDTFRDALRANLADADTGNRAAAAETAIVWDGKAFLEALGDAGQPAEVTAALLRGAQTYGWAWVSGEDDFAKTVERMLRAKEPGRRRLGLKLLRFAPRQAAGHWLEALGGPDAGEREAVFRLWVDALVDEQDFPGEVGPHLGPVEDALYQALYHHDKGPRAEQAAVVIAVLCTAARRMTEALGRTPPVDVRQALAERARGGPAATAYISLLRKLKQVLRCLSVARAVAVDPRRGRAEFRLRLPDEGGGAPPARNLREFTLERARPALAWCRRHAGEYSSPFLVVDSFHFPAGGGPRAGEWRNLGQVLKSMGMDTDEALAELARRRMPE